MMSSVEEIVAKASELGERERATIATLILKGLPKPSYDISDKEVDERRRQLESGEVDDISLDDLKAGLDL